MRPTRVSTPFLRLVNKSDNSPVMVTPKRSARDSRVLGCKECRVQLVEPLPQRTDELLHCNRAASFHQRHLEVRTTYIQSR